MSNSLKEKVIEILNKQENYYRVLGLCEGENKIADQILSLFEAERKKWEKNILKEMKCQKENHEDQLCGGCENCNIYKKLVKSLKKSGE